MQAVTYDRHGVPSEVLRCAAVDVVAPQRGQAVVAIDLAAIHPSDLLTIRGAYAARPTLPGAVPGQEGVGRVIDVGPEASVAVGTRVLLPLGSGTWRDTLTTSARLLTPVPDAADAAQLALGLLNPLTAHLLLTSIVALRPGEWVIQNAANGAVGQLVARLARDRGLRTVNVVRRATAERIVHGAGGHVVVQGGDDLPETVRRYTGGAPIRLALDAVGGPDTARLARCLTVGGTVVSYGALSGQPFALGPHDTIFRDVRLQGFWLHRWMQQATPEARQAATQAVLPSVTEGALHVPIEKVYALSDVRQAVDHAEKQGRDGKILLAPSDDPR